MKLIETFFGTLTGITERKTGKSYPETDWRQRYAGRPGMIAVYKSDHQAGKQYIFFYPDDPNSQMQDWLRTSAGDLQVIKDEYTLMSKNSTYRFGRDDETLPEERKQLMRLNVGIQSDGLTTQELDTGCKTYDHNL